MINGERRTDMKQRYRVTVTFDQTVCVEQDYVVTAESEDEAEDLVLAGTWDEEGEYSEDIVDQEPAEVAGVEVLPEVLP
jgi:hypothetical protein